MWPKVRSDRITLDQVNGFSHREGSGLSVRAMAMHRGVWTRSLPGHAEGGDC